MVLENFSWWSWKSPGFFVRKTVTKPIRQLNESKLMHLSSLFVTWQYRLSQSVNGGGDQSMEKSFILNKVAQLFTQSCLVDYPRRRSTFFDNLIESTCLGPSAVDLCLRVLLAIDGEVVDRDIAHTDQVCSAMPSVLTVGGWPLVPESHAKSCNSGRRFSRPGKSWKTEQRSWKVMHRVATHLEGK